MALCSWFCSLSKGIFISFMMWQSKREFSWIPLRSLFEWQLRCGFSFGCDPEPFGHVCDSRAAQQWHDAALAFQYIREIEKLPSKMHRMAKMSYNFYRQSYRFDLAIVYFYIRYLQRSWISIPRRKKAKHNYFVFWFKNDSWSNYQWNINAFFHAALPWENRFWTS